MSMPEPHTSVNNSLGPGIAILGFKCRHTFKAFASTDKVYVGVGNGLSYFISNSIFKVLERISRRYVGEVHFLVKPY